MEGKAWWCQMTARLDSVKVTGKEATIVLKAAATSPGPGKILGQVGETLLVELRSPQLGFGALEEKRDEDTGEIQDE